MNGRTTSWDPSTEVERLGRGVDVSSPLIMEGGSSQYSSFSSLSPFRRGNSDRSPSSRFGAGAGVGGSFEGEWRETETGRDRVTVGRGKGVRGSGDRGRKGGVL